MSQPLFVKPFVAHVCTHSFAMLTPRVVIRTIVKLDGIEVEVPHGTDPNKCFLGNLRQGTSANQVEAWFRSRLDCRVEAHVRGCFAVLKFPLATTALKARLQFDGVESPLCAPGKQLKINVAFEKMGLSPLASSSESSGCERGVKQPHQPIEPPPPESLLVAAPPEKPILVVASPLRVSPPVRVAVPKRVSPPNVMPPKTDFPEKPIPAWRCEVNLDICTASKAKPPPPPPPPIEATPEANLLAKPTPMPAGTVDALFFHMKGEAAFDDETGMLKELEVKTEEVDQMSEPTKPSRKTSYAPGVKRAAARVLTPRADRLRWPKHKFRDLRAKRKGYYEIGMDDEQ